MKFLKSISDNQQPDHVLAEEYRISGDLEILSVIFSRYMDLLYGVCFKYLKDGERAKDAVMQIHEALIVTLRKHEVKNVKSWLFSVAKNHCLMQIRSAKNLKTVELSADHVQSGEELHQNEQMEKENHLGLLEKCLDTLAPGQQAAVKLFYLQNKCYHEIAGITGTDVGSVRSHIQNGRRNLKICMEKNHNARVG